MSSKDSRRAPTHIHVRSERRVAQSLKDYWTHYESSWGFSMMEPVSCPLRINTVATFVLTTRFRQWEKIFLRV
jgi:hypothetical protein